MAEKPTVSGMDKTQLLLGFMAHYGKTDIKTSILGEFVETHLGNLSEQTIYNAKKRYKKLAAGSKEEKQYLQDLAKKVLPLLQEDSRSELPTKAPAPEETPAAKPAKPQLNTCNENGVMVQLLENFIAKKEKLTPVQILNWVKNYHQLMEFPPFNE